MAACHEFSGEDYYIGKLAHAKAMLVSNFKFYEYMLPIRGQDTKVDFTSITF